MARKIIDQRFLGSEVTLRNTKLPPKKSPAERKRIAEAVAWNMLSATEQLKVHRDAVMRADDYAEGLRQIGELLIRAKILTAEQIGRHGIGFAVRDRCEPLPEGDKEYLRCRDALLQRWRDGNAWVSERLVAERPVGNPLKKRKR